MKLSPRGVKLIQDFEGCKLKAYRCSAGVATVGYGHTEGVYMGLTIDQQHAEDLLKSDLVRFEEIVNKLVRVQITQGQYDSLVSFAFNCGEGNLAKSTLLKMINEGKGNMAGAQFLRWDKAKGTVIAGLTRRREAEKALFES